MGRALTSAALPRSLWRETAGEWTPRPPLAGDRDYDVAIVGAGFTGLWTAYHLVRADPHLRVCVIEAEDVGFGASGRNGGWCSALFPVSTHRIVATKGLEAATAMHAAMRDSVSEVERTCAEEGIDAHFAKGGTVAVARSPVQLERARKEVEAARHWGRGEEDLRLLGRREARELFGAKGVLGATYTPDCASLHPLRLVRGVAAAAERRGVTIHESTRALEVSPGRVVTDRGVVRADVVVRATEGYTAGLPGLERALAPVYSLIVATEPLSEEQWERIGLAQRPTFTELRHLVVYGQRSADGRIVFGGRGAPYHFGSRVRPEFDSETRVWAALRATVREMMPDLDDVTFTHAWGGALGVPRDWAPSVGLDRSTGLAWAGGYVGDGVSTTNLAGRTLADLILKQDTDLTRLPWAQHRSPRWEPEPLRWLGVNGGLRAIALADREERFTGRPSHIARLMGPLLGE